MDLDDMAIGVVGSLLESNTGQKLTEDRRWRVGTALSGLFRNHNIGSSSELVARLTCQDDDRFVQEVIDALLNNETYFFRDRAVFDLIKQDILPKLAASKANKRHLSIWSMGCSTGQEAFSLAMMFAEQKARWNDWTIDILGTDISTKVIAAARRGCYSHFEVQRGLGVGQMLTYFKETPLGWQVDPELQKMVRFQDHNLLDQAPSPGKFDLILCRNVLLYFDLPTRTRAFDRLSKAMLPDSVLLLGGGETVIGQTSHFETTNKQTGVYRLVDRPSTIADFQRERANG